MKVFIAILCFGMCVILAEIMALGIQSVAFYHSNVCRVTHFNPYISAFGDQNDHSGWDAIVGCGYENIRCRDSIRVIYDSLEIVKQAHFKENAECQERLKTKLSVRLNGKVDSMLAAVGLP